MDVLKCLWLKQVLAEMAFILYQHWQQKGANHTYYLLIIYPVKGFTYYVMWFL
jgi:hypothetical protein